MPSNIYKTLKDMNAFNLFLEGIEAVKLTEDLKDKGPYTIIAPVEDAIRKLPKKTIFKLFHNKEVLRKVFSNHILPGKHSSYDLSHRKSIPTLEGNMIEIYQNGDKIGTANILVKDIVGTNGVIHIVDNLIIPDDLFDFHI
ncbi:MAG: fasciclin domain-containing protein [Promethearchaeota archaeon]